MVSNIEIKKETYKNLTNEKLVYPFEKDIIEEEKPTPSLPVGSGGELEQRTARDPERRVVFVPVDNKVIMVNEEIMAPFNLVLGKPTPFGLYAYSPDEENSGFKGTTLETLDQHKRSALFARTLFADKEGRVYRDVDIKGVGYITDDGNPTPVVYPPGGKTAAGDVYGFTARDFAFVDFEFSEKFLQAGIRAHRVIDITELRQYITDGKKRSFKGLFGRQRVPGMDQGYHPVVEIRAFGTRARIANIDDELLIDDAKKIVSWELGRKTVMTDEEYLLWFARILGTNVGIMHANGWVHRYLTGHNITLDCRLTDFDSVWESESEVDRSIDFAQSRDSLRILYERLRKRRSLFKNKILYEKNEKKNDYYDYFENSSEAREYDKSYRAAFPQGGKIV